MKTAIVIGVGPDRGLGGQLCRRFAAEGLHVLVAGRTKEKLDAIAETIRKEGGSAEGVVADATLEADTQALFERAGDDLSLAIYNAGNNTPGRIADMEASYFEKSWRICCFGGFLFGRAFAGFRLLEFLRKAFLCGSQFFLRGPGLLELRQRTVERRSLVASAAGERERKGVQHDPLAAKLRQRDVLPLVALEGEIGHLGPGFEHVVVLLVRLRSCRPSGRSADGRGKRAPCPRPPRDRRPPVSLRAPARSASPTLESAS